MEFSAWISADSKPGGQWNLDGVLARGKAASSHPFVVTVPGVAKVSRGALGNAPERAGGAAARKAAPGPTRCDPLRPKRHSRHQRMGNLQSGSEIPQEHRVVQGPSPNDAVTPATRVSNEFDGLARAVAINERV